MNPLFKREIEEFKWLQDHPQFKMRPATIREFLGPGYLDEPAVRTGVIEGLVEVFGEEIDPDSISRVRRATFTGAIGIGKTFFASIALTYMVHWVKCLKDPQEYFGLAKGTVISFMLMSTSQKLAQEVTFGATKARIENSIWFKNHSPVVNEKQTTQMRFPGDIWIVPGTSEETSFEGHNILAGIVDEGDSHKITAKKDYADAGYDTINSRIASRYPNFIQGDHRGLIIAIGQMKSKSGFMSRKYKAFLTDPSASAMRMSIWESFGWHNFTTDKGDIDRHKETSPRDSFYFDQRRRQIITKEAAAFVTNKDLIEVPMVFQPQFVDDPVKALRDLAGIPPEADDPFISQTDRILDCQQLWHDRLQTDDPPVNDKYDLSDIVLPPWVRNTDDFKRVIHIDTAYSARGDALAIAMGHVPERVERHSEERPLIVFDLLVRIKARSGTQIDFGDVREFIYMLRDERGFEIDQVTLDGFNTVDFIQEMRKKKIQTDYLSVDKSKRPYENLRETINDRRCLFPRYMTLVNPTDTLPINIAYKELSELSDVGRKIDHPPLGSKDVADAMAGVVDLLVTIPKYGNQARSAPNEKRDEISKSGLEGIFAPANETSVVSFEEFSRNQNEYLSQSIPSVDMNDDLMKGLGEPPSRVW